MQYKLTTNTAFNSREIYFDAKPDAKVIEALKGQKMRWNHVKSCWYGYANENDIIEAINKAICADAAEKAPEAIAIGGVTSDGYMGGGEWTGCNAHKLSDVTDINKAIKAELKRLYPNVIIKTRGKKFSGGQSSDCYVCMHSAELFRDRDIIIQAYKKAQYHYDRIDYTDTDGKWISVRGYDATAEQRDIAAEQSANKLLSEYVCSLELRYKDLYKEILTDRAIEIIDKAKALYDSFVHEDSNSQVDYFSCSLYTDFAAINLDHISQRKEWEV